MDSKRTIDYVLNCQWFGTDILFGLMYEYISPYQSLLDIGIGTGLSSKLFNQYGLAIYGIDGSEEMIKISRNKTIAKDFRQVNLTQNDAWFENKIFDHIISHGVFHLIGDLNYIFNETSRILRQNGCFGFTYEGFNKSTDDFRQTSIEGIYECQNLQSGIKEYRHTENYILGLIEKNGFQVLKMTEFLAFVDLKTKQKTYFNIIIAKLK